MRWASFQFINRFASFPTFLLSFFLFWDLLGNFIFKRCKLIFIRHQKHLQVSLTLLTFKNCHNLRQRSHFKINLHIPHFKCFMKHSQLTQFVSLLIHHISLITKNEKFEALSLCIEIFNYHHSHYRLAYKRMRELCEINWTRHLIEFLSLVCTVFIFQHSQKKVRVGNEREKIKHLSTHKEKQRNEIFL